MTELFEVTISATGEVRDAEGNLVSSQPIQITRTMTADELRASGLDASGGTPQP